MEDLSVSEIEWELINSGFVVYNARGQELEEGWQIIPGSDQWVVEAGGDKSVPMARLYAGRVDREFSLFVDQREGRERDYSFLKKLLTDGNVFFSEVIFEECHSPANYKSPYSEPPCKSFPDMD